MSILEIRIQTAPIDAMAEYCAVHAPENGARVLFSGCVRPEENGRIIHQLDYEHFEGMAQKELRRLADEACRRWGINALRVVHRVGAIPVAEESIVIVAAAGHRAEAFEAARFIIDELKKSVPIWKSAPA
jgi:molybdopterin synthase catalytic subunit